ncbi:hypothetical protein [Candidatus Electronema sp. TJ]|uniref:hypothetical protein n=1 Tax=Candidatus Electronema sp. TJ TaxID=3401573 RepID=UPI003AA7FCC1
MKDIDIFARVQYWRIFFALTFPCVIFGGIAFFFMGWPALPLAFALNALFPFPLMLLTDRVASWFVMLCGGGSGGPAKLRERLAGEMDKARYLKVKEKFAEALETVNFILEQMPAHDEALLLKARILFEGFVDRPGAKECLRQILRQEDARNETVRHWAAELLKEIQGTPCQQLAGSNNS